MYDAYRCSCGKLHSTDQDARECACCLVDFVAVCEGCGKDYFDQDEAAECEASH